MERPVLALALVSALAIGCGAALPAPGAPEEEGLPLVFPPAPPPGVAPPAIASGPEPSPPPPGASLGACSLQWTPRDLGASVIHIPAELATRMMVPFYRALCACSRPGQSLLIVATMVPDRGEVTAHTEARPEIAARASVSIDACLARELGAGLFEPFPLRGDVICDPPPVTPVRRPGEPAPIWVPRRAGCGNGDTEASFARIGYPVHVDRRDEPPP
jgi:hypothetical protein